MTISTHPHIKKVHSSQVQGSKVYLAIIHHAVLWREVCWVSSMSEISCTDINQNGTKYLIFNCSILGDVIGLQDYFQLRCGWGMMGSYLCSIS